jgi:hypothetical protein
MHFMNGFCRLLHSVSILAVLAGLLTPGLARALPVNLTEDEFKTYDDYLDALQDERVVKLRPNLRLAAIAHNFKISTSKLKGIVDKGQQWPSIAAIGKACEEAIRASVQGTPLAERLDMVEVDVGNPHVVAYVSWTEGDSDKLLDEAVLLAAKVKKAAPISADIRIWAEDSKDKAHKVFDGLILGEAAGRFQESRIPDFARTRYVKAFQFARTDPPQALLPGSEAQTNPPPTPPPPANVPPVAPVSANPPPANTPPPNPPPH